MRPVLLLGHTGRLGSALMAVLTKAGYPVEGKSSADWDLSDLDPLHHEIGGWACHHPDGVVINATGLTDIDMCETNPAKSHKLNTLVPMNLAEACRRRNVPFLHFTTDQAYGPVDHHAGYFYPRHHPREREPNGELKWPAINRYGQDKAIGEEHVLLYDQAVTMTVQWLYGAPDFGGQTSWLDREVRRLRRHQPVAALEDYLGRPTYVGDVARAALAVIAKLSLPPARGGQRLHLIPTGQRISRFDLVKEIASLIGSHSVITRQTRADVATVWAVDRSSVNVADFGGPGLPNWRDRLKNYLMLPLGAEA